MLIDYWMLKALERQQSQKEGLQLPFLTCGGPQNSCEKDAFSDPKQENNPHHRG
jgi:hypothetical protein